MYLYDSMADIGERLDRITTKFIPIFIEIGKTIVMFLPERTSDT
jgi:hypothetical protein